MLRVILHIILSMLYVALMVISEIVLLALVFAPFVLMYVVVRGLIGVVVWVIRMIGRWL